MAQLFTNGQIDAFATTFTLGEIYESATSADRQQAAATVEGIWLALPWEEATPFTSTALKEQLTYHYAASIRFVLENEGSLSAVNTKINDLLRSYLGAGIGEPDARTARMVFDSTPTAANSPAGGATGASSFAQLAGKIAADQIPDDSIAEPKLAPAVRTKLNASPQAGASAFTDLTGQIAANQIPDDRIVRRMVGNSAIGTDELGTNSVTNPKVASIDASKLTGTIAAQRLPDGVSIFPVYTDGGTLPWTDRTYAPRSLVTRNGATYINIHSTSGKSKAETEPGVGSSWATYWHRVGFATQSSGGASAFTDLTGKLAASQIPDGLIAKRMMADVSVGTDQLEDDAITSDKLAKAVRDSLGGSGGGGGSAVTWYQASGSSNVDLASNRNTYTSVLTVSNVVVAAGDTVVVWFDGIVEERSDTSSRAFTTRILRGTNIVSSEFQGNLAATTHVDYNLPLTHNAVDTGVSAGTYSYSVSISASGSGTRARHRRIVVGVFGAASGGGGTSGLTAVHSDATLTGTGTATSLLKVANPLTAAKEALLLPTFPAAGSRDNKVPKFDGDTLAWETDAGDTGGARDDVARASAKSASDSAQSATRLAQSASDAAAHNADTLADISRATYTNWADVADVHGHINDEPFGFILSESAWGSEITDSVYRVEVAKQRLVGAYIGARVPRGVDIEQMRVNELNLENVSVDTYPDAGDGQSWRYQTSDRSYDYYVIHKNNSQVNFAGTADTNLRLQRADRNSEIKESAIPAGIVSTFTKVADEAAAKAKPDDDGIFYYWTE